MFLKDVGTKCIKRERFRISRDRQKELSVSFNLKTNLLSVPSKVEETEREGVSGRGGGGGGISVSERIQRLKWRSIEFVLEVSAWR